MKLTLIRGLPGSSKSTYAKKHFRCLILENDMFSETDGKYQWSADNVKRGIALVRKMADMTLANGNDVVVCNTFTRKRFVECYKQLAEEHGADFEVIRMCGQFESIHNVPKDVLKSMHDSFEDWDGEIKISP